MDDREHCDGGAALQSRVTSERSDQPPFPAHVELLRSFLGRRGEIVEAILALLSAQRAPAPDPQDGPVLSRRFEDCFFALAGVTPAQARLRGQLQQAHWASGFRPRVMPGLHNDLIDPGEMMLRGLHLWRQTRWPGRNGRARYAHALFDAYLIRCLELLAMRLWDDGSGRAGERLSQVQGVLDELWSAAPADRPVLVRDARWLIPLAQSPTTDELAGYFEVAERIAESLSDEDRLQIHKASVQMAGGHLRSQLRHRCMTEGVDLDAKSLVLSSRNSNALDFAMLIQGLAPLLDAYERAVHGGDRGRRLELAGAICQGISADPELFVNRVDLLGAYSMIEHLFVTTDRESRAVHSPMGRRHVQALQEYAGRIGRLSTPLHDDCPHFRPVDGAYSPYGVIYGFSSNLTEHMALKTLQADAATRFSVEDVFAEGEADKLAWVSGWRKLPHIDPQVQRRFDYPQRFAEEIFERIARALRTRAAAGEASADRAGRLSIADPSRPADIPLADVPVADVPVEYIGSSDTSIVEANRAHACEQTRLLRDRQEGMFLVSYETQGGWTAVSKDILTEILGAGRDARIVGLPAGAAGVLRLMCPALLAPTESAAG
ncbi:MAG: hypothetical protein ACREUG_04630 [Steroidobacteraceae bacterium]